MEREELDRYSLWGFALILGGAAGNVFDRIVRGQVTDFLLFLHRRVSMADVQRGGLGHRDRQRAVAARLLRPKRQAANVS